MDVFGHNILSIHFKALRCAFLLQPIYSPGRQSPAEPSSAVRGRAACSSGNCTGPCLRSLAFVYGDFFGMFQV